MNNESTTPPALNIVRPGHATFHVGPFNFPTERDEWVSGLRQMMHSTAHIEGTTIEPAPYDTSVDPGLRIDPYALPSDPYELATLMRDESSGDGTGTNFPDLYARLCLQLGDGPAKRIWIDAGRIIDDEAELDQRRRDTTEGAHAVTGLLGEAEHALMEAQQRIHHITKDLADFEGEMDPLDAGDAQREIDHMLRSIRHVYRIMRPYRKASTSDI
jgi:hypothetical protein